MSSAPGCHRLSGYLYYKPTGAFSRLRTKRRQWYIYQETQHQILYYRSHEDAIFNKKPLGVIDINGASISLNLEDLNLHQFFIQLNDGQEWLLEADNHESMMMWVVGLQHGRDCCVSNKSRGSLDYNLARRRVSEPAIKSFPQSMTQSYHNGDTLTPCNSSMNVHSPDQLQLSSGSYRPFGNGSSIASSTNYIDSYCSPVHEETDDDPVVIHCVPQSATNQTTRSQSSLYLSTVRPIDALLSGGDEVFTLEERNPEKSFRFFHSNQSSLKSGMNRIPWSDTPRSARISELSKLGLTRLRRSSSTESVVHQEIIMRHRIIELEKELLDARSTIADSVNQENCLRELLHKRDEVLAQLDEKVSRLEELENILNRQNPSGSVREHVGLPSNQRPRERLMDSGTLRANQQIKNLTEQNQRLLKQNRFLNEEVKKLAALRMEDHKRISAQEKRICALEMDIKKWKRDYVILLQSSITVPSGDVSDGFELNLYGGDRHKFRLIELLEEAREMNPGLPTFERLAQSSQHVDNYGFKHNHENESLLLHYICHQLNDYYTCQLVSYEGHQLQWALYTEANRYKTWIITKELKTLCRSGIPSHYRSEVWRHLIHAQVKELMNKHGKHYYANLSNQLSDSEIAGCHRKQIALDLLRTMPTNIHFDHYDSDGIKKLQEVLQVYTMHNPEIGYCQGMNFIAGFALLFLDKEDAFWCLVAFLECFFPPHYFDSNLIGAQADQMVMKDLIAKKLPQLCNNFRAIDIDISTITLNWFLSVYFDAVPLETLVRIWDCFLLEGPKVIFRVAVAILHMHERILVQQTDTISIWKQLKLAAKLTFDVDGLFKVAFEGLKPFPSREKLLKDQQTYMVELLEMERKKALKRKAFEDYDRNLLYEPTNSSSVTCLGDLGQGKLWLCHGDQYGGNIAEIDCDQNITYEVNFELDCRILCILSWSTDVVLLGSLSKTLYAFDPNTKNKLWQLLLPDSVMDLCAISTNEDNQSNNRLFAGLGNGSIAIMENVSRQEPLTSPFYISFDVCPVSSLLVVNQDLWCASGNTVRVINANTLDQRGSFRVSCNPLDHILCMRSSIYGVWICVKGSSIIQLWSDTTPKCKSIYDVKENKYLLSRKEEDTGFNPQRVTSLLPLGNTIWVGSGEGDLTVYEISENVSSVSGLVFQRGKSLDKARTLSFMSDTSHESPLQHSSSFSSEKISICKTPSPNDYGSYNNGTPESESPPAVERRKSMKSNVAVNLLVRNKVAESPIRCLKELPLHHTTVIMSCSSRFEEDECILKWSRVNNENKIWTNIPVFRMCQLTNTVRLPTYMKHRLAFSSSRDSFVDY